MKAKFWCALITIGLMSLSMPQAVLGQEQNSLESELSVPQQAEAERANRLNEQAIELYQQGQYPEATTLFEEALKIRREIYQGDHRDVATSLNNLALLYNAQGKDTEAEPLYQEALAMNKRLFPGDHRDVATSLNNLAELYRSQERFAEAEPLYKEALEMNKHLFPDDHLNVATNLNNLAVLYLSQGEFTKAESLLVEALSMSKRLLPSDHPDISQSLGNLAEIHREQGRYDEAEPLYKEALEMNKRLFPGDHLNVATNLNNLALLYRSQGRFTEAEPLVVEALAMSKRLFSKDHSYVAATLNNLAELYRSQRRFAEAEPLVVEALAMSKRLFSKDHSYVAHNLNSLAEIYRVQRRFAEAEPLVIEALSINRKLFSKDHPNVATSLNNLALLYNAQGRYAEAETLYKDSLAMRKKIYSGEHAEIVQSLNNIGIFYQEGQKYSQALEYLIQSSKAEENIITENLLIGSEQQKKQFLNLFQNSTYAQISFHLQAVPEHSEASELALTTILRRKGRVLDAMGQTLQNLRDNLGSESEKLFVQLASTQTELANLSARPLPDDAIQRQNIQAQQTELDKQIKQLEAQLSSRSAEFAQQTTPVTIEQVQQAIPNNGALVEFIQYKPFNAKESTYSEPRYAVYVLLPNGQMQWQDLGEASVVDLKIKCFRESLNKKGGRGLAAVSSCPENFSTVARELDELLMKPVRSMVGNATHLLLSPDSQLNTLPFAALVDEQDKYLVENYLITYLTSGRDLLRLQLNQNQDTSQPLLMANPTYSSPGVLTKASPKEDVSRGRRSGELATLKPFKHLEGTKIEGEAIDKIVPNLRVLVEQEASENNLKQIENPEFLHLATHGFFLPPQPEELNNDRSNGSTDNQTPVFSTTENPLLRSGLALAGINQRDSGTEDGVLTALEVTGLNLRGTKLVVMSACETGLGDVQAGEGVYGLRRAFTLAGAQSQLMSLWSVDDEGTKDLMVEYYSRIQNGEARGEALRQVQLEMLRSENRSHPFFWAAFIPSGSWLPLDSSH